jgi:hypothetical protein
MGQGASFSDVHHHHIGRCEPGGFNTIGKCLFNQAGGTACNENPREVKVANSLPQAGKTVRAAGVWLAGSVKHAGLLSGLIAKGFGIQATADLMSACTDDDP